MDISLSADANESRFSEIIENYAKESQQNIMSLGEDIRRLRKDKESLDKEYQTLSGKFKDYE